MVSCQDTFFFESLSCQVKELVEWVDQSNADFVILGGDFNTSPRDKETSYKNLKQMMTNSMEEFFVEIKVNKILFQCQNKFKFDNQEWLCPSKATYGNPKNTYSYMYQPVLQDYIWLKSCGWNMIWTNFFDVSKLL